MREGEREENRIEQKYCEEREGGRPCVKYSGAIDQCTKTHTQTQRHKLTGHPQSERERERERSSIVEKVRKEPREYVVALGVRLAYKA